MKRGFACLMMIIAGNSLAGERVPVSTYADDPIVGWHWYNEPLPTEAPEEEDSVPLTALPANLQMSLLQKLVRERLNRAILNPSTENTGEYLRLQQMVTTQAGLFTKSAQKALLMFPELDYNIQHSHYNGTATVQLTAVRERQQAAVQQLGQKYGLFLFYRGDEAIDNLMASVVSQFAASHDLSLIPISVDGKRSDALPQTRPDTGQAASMGVTHFPALYLVAPDAGQYQPLSYGFVAQDDLARRFLDVATDFTSRY
ncbi:type-F conjugative transfer system pilin assembly protein TraF [Entomohabitans teleogrylli]|uniref:type-F conjugative transfer system pilin assembly protein TraF n=1 Tax=Entomohabitans teleogrylli TaxID=1384589 RepID=UPI000A6E8979|nr:type-F conjugative transfer system pilin assembly protein TraF [Entomohabitans teleogrylli]